MKIDEMKNDKPRPLRLGDRRPVEFSRARAEAISLQALVFLAHDPDRIERFLSLTGIQPGDMRGLAGETGFQLAVLDHLASDERLLMQFAAEEGIDPNDVGGARRALGGDDRE
jgi:hypothetical protein